MPTEIERRFFVKDIGSIFVDDKVLSSPEGSAGNGSRYERKNIHQGYLRMDKACTVRVRIEDQNGFLTIKGSPLADDPLARPEFEYVIPFGDAKELMKLCTKYYVTKTRYLIPASDGLKWEVDIFLGHNFGLVIAEIELPSADTSFELPKWIGPEITGNEELSSLLSNASLAQNPFREWSEEDLLKLPSNANVMVQHG